MITIHDCEQGSADWHAIRDGLITGSMAEKLLTGMGDLDYARNAESKFTGNFATQRGHVLEDRAIALYEKIYKTIVARPGFITNDKYTSCGYSPDGLDVDDQPGVWYRSHLGTLLEVKCFYEKKHMEIFDGHIPVKVMAQIQFGLMICELKQARLIIYNPDIPEPLRAFKVIPIKANRDIQANFKRILSKEPSHV